jgi:zinc transport system permease protein
MDEFLWRALSAGIGVALIAGAVGSFLVWRRMAFFGDTLSHSALLGIAFGLFLDIDLTLAALLMCVLVAAGYARLQGSRLLASDTMLAVIAHGSLAVGIIAVSLLAPRRASLEGYLFGDLLAVGPAEMQLIYGVGFLVALVSALCWQPWLSMAVDEELARIEGVPVDRLRLLQMLVTAALIGVSMKVVGVLLVTALMIIPPATARAFARSPEQMAAGGALIGCISVVAGLWMSFTIDTPAGPSVAAAACLLFVLAHVLAPRR